MPETTVTSTCVNLKLGHGFMEGRHIKMTAKWKTVRLGDVAKTSSGGTPNRGVGAYYGGEIPWVKSGELGDSTVYETQENISKTGLANSSAKLFPKGTLCVALYGATVGKLGILGMDAATNQAVCGIFLPKEIDTRFAYRFLESKRRELIEMGKGGAQSNISQQIIRKLEFPFPPTDEQRRIVAEIEKQFTRLEAGVAALRRVQANLKRYRAAVLKAACEGKLVPTEAELAKKGNRKSKFETGEALLARILTERRQNWQGRGKYKEPVAPNTANLPLLAGRMDVGEHGATWRRATWSAAFRLTMSQRIIRRNTFAPRISRSAALIYRTCSTWKFHRRRVNASRCETAIFCFLKHGQSGARSGKLQRGR